MLSEKKKGQLFVISAPSGAGKSTLAGMLLKEFPTASYSISYTTRPPRGAEQNGKHYHFVDKSTFEAMIASGEFIEYATVHGNYYGTSKKAIAAQLEEGDIILDIDPQGAMQLKAVIDAVFIFILPPSLETLRERLEKRGDTGDALELRLKNAEKELNYMSRYDYAVVNDELAQAYRELASIYIAGRCSTKLLEWPLNF